MKKPIMTVALAATTLSLFASAPEVSEVTVPDGPYLPKATVSYKLSGEAGVVTFELQTNGVPVDCNYLNVSGDINRLLQPGEYSFTWSSADDWPNHKDKDVEAKIVVKAWSVNAPPDYMIVPLVKNSTEPVRYYAKAGDIPGGLSDIRYKTDYLAMRLIHARGVIWEMGGHPGDSDVNSNEGLHLAALTDDYYIGVYPITVAQYNQTVPSGRALSNALGTGEVATRYVNDTSDYGRTRPAVGPCPKYYLIGNGTEYYWPANAESLSVVSTWYFGLLRERTGIPRLYLPTSTQWEFACRAGVKTKFYNGSPTSIGNTGWCTSNNDEDKVWATFPEAPHAVGLRDPNAWDLYDMHGNVNEWCCDSTCSGTEKTSDGTPLVDPAGGRTSDSWRLRGGSFQVDASKCGAFDIGADSYGTQSIVNGFRVTCPATAVK